MGEIHAEDQKELDDVASFDVDSCFFPPAYLCEGLEELAEFHAEAKQALLERTGHYEDLLALLEKRPGDVNPRELG